MLALLAEERETCPGCGQQMNDCYGPTSAQSWHVEEEICQACIVLEATRDNEAERPTRRRGVHMYVERNA